MKANVNNTGSLADAAVSAATAPKSSTIRNKCIFLGILLAVACILSLCISTTTYEVYGLDTAFRALKVWVQTTFATLFQGEHFNTSDLAQLEPNYFQVMTRIGAIFTSVICGIILTVSGSIYQSVFRNPVASPTMLGVSSGLNFGLVIFVLIFSTAALSPEYALFHYLFAYGGAIIVLGIVLGFSYVMNGPKCFNVVDMLLIGSIVSLMLGQVVLFISYQVFTEDQWLAYTTINEVMTVDTSLVAYLFLGAAFLLTFTWVVLFRFRFNALSFTDEDARGFGINSTRLRYFAIVIATIMITAGLAHSGMVGMITLVVPFAARAFFGAEFRKQLIGNILIGATMVVTCRAIASLFSIALHYMGLVFDFPIGIIASFICMPLFVWIVASQQKTWN